ncbi:MAG: hypothetical protein HY332_09245 [Chloroflexi bacterium]|nr:hypothetical protein [Chloroflexota bacterium]
MMRGAISLRLIIAYPACHRPLHRRTRPFYMRPGPDGRGNVQALALVRAAVAAGRQVRCFDHDANQPMVRWTDRDRRLATGSAIELRRVSQHYSLELSLPRAAPATFLTPPMLPP